MHISGGVMTICRELAEILIVTARMAHTLGEKYSGPFVQLLTDNERLQKPRLLLERVQSVLARRPKPLQRLAVERANLVLRLDKLPPGKMLPRLLSLLASLLLVGIWTVTVM